MRFAFYKIRRTWSLHVRPTPRPQVSGYFLIRNSFFPDSKILRPHVIGFVSALVFSTLRADSKLSGFADACRRKPYPERKSCGFKNIRIRVYLALVLLRNRGTVTNIKEHVTPREFALFIRTSFWSLVANLRKCQKKALQ